MMFDQRIDDRSVVSNAAGEDEVHAGADALDHHAATEDARFHGGANAAGAVDGVDCAHVMAMAAVHRNARLLVDAERRAEQRELGIVDRERIAGEHGVDPAAADQLDEVIRPAGVNDHRSSDEDDRARRAPWSRASSPRSCRR